MNIDLDNPDIMSSSEAAKIWGKNETYVRTSIKQSSDKWPKGTYRRFGKTIVVTTKGMEAVTGIKDPRKNK